MSDSLRTPLPVIIDTDPGLGEPGADIDDGFAIALALMSPEIELIGLTIVNGNVDAPTGVDVARRLTSRLGHPDIPVLQGACEPLARDMEPVRRLFEAAAPGAFGSQPKATLVGPTSDQHAVDWMIETVRERPGQIVVIAIGPMTNLATAIRRDSSFAENVRELVLMAGSATTYAQNITTVGDFNTFVDPEALDIVIRSGADIAMVGLDQTARVNLTRDDAAYWRSLGGADDFGTWAADCTDAWIDYLGRAFPNRPEHRDACFLHDPLVVAVTIRRDLCRWERAHVQVETVSDLARGLVVADRGLALSPIEATNASVAVDTNVAVFRGFFLERIGGAVTPADSAT